jgi:hypothetical protein
VSYMKSLIEIVVEDKSRDLREMNEMGEAIVRELQKLEQDIISDKSSLEVERKALESKLTSERGAFPFLAVGICC